MKRAIFTTLLTLIFIFNSQSQVIQDNNPDQLGLRAQKHQAPWNGTLEIIESAKNRTTDFGDPPNLKWAKQFGGDGIDAAYDVTEDPQNNTYAIGSFSGNISIGGNDYTSEGKADMYILKTSVTGDVIWFKTFSPQVDGFMRGTSIKHKNGSLVLAGFIEGSTDFGTGGNTISSDIDFVSFIGEIDEEGEFIWYDSYWNQTLNARFANKIDRDNSGSIYLLTGRRSSTFEPDGTLTKFDENGNILLEFNESIHINRFELSSFGIYLTGTLIEPITLGPVAFEPTTPENAFIARSNLNFSFEWGHMVDRIPMGYGTSIASVIALDASENVYFGGRYNGSVIIENSSSPQGVNNGLYYAKLDIEGNYEWISYLDNTNLPVFPSQACISTSGDFIVSGPLSRPYISVDGSSIPPDRSTTSLLLVFDKNNGSIANELTNNSSINAIRNNGFDNILTAGVESGNFSLSALNENLEDEWALKSVGESGSVSNWANKKVFMDSDANNYCITAFVNNLNYEEVVIPSPDEGIAIIKTDVNGNPLWINGLESSVSITHIDADISPDQSNIVITGEYVGTIETNLGNFTTIDSKNFIAKFNSNTGDLQFFKTLDVNIFGIAIDQSNTIIASGAISATANIDGVSLTSNGSSDYYIAKFNSSGTLLWAKNFGGESSEFSPYVDVDGQGNIYVYANSNSSVITFENNVDLLLNDIGGYKILVKYDPVGTPIWAINFSGSNSPNSNISGISQSIQVTDAGDIFIEGVMGFDNNFGNIQLVSPYYNQNNPGPYRINVFLAKIDTDGTFVWANMIHKESNVFDSRQTAVDEIGNVYITSRLRGNAYFSEEAFIENLSDQSTGIVAKYDTLGQISWVKSIGNDGNRPAGIAAFAEDQLSISGEFFLTQEMVGNVFNPINSNIGYLASTTDQTTNTNFKPVNYFQLSTAPNPFTDQFTLRYELEKNDEVRIRIFDLQGRLVKRINVGTRSFGEQQETISMNNLGAGMYFVNLISNEKSGIIKIEKVR